MLAVVLVPFHTEDVVLESQALHQLASMMSVAGGQHLLPLLLRSANSRCNRWRCDREDEGRSALVTRPSSLVPDAKVSNLTEQLTHDRGLCQGVLKCLCV